MKCEKAVKLAVFITVIKLSNFFKETMIKYIIISLFLLLSATSYAQSQESIDYYQKGAQEKKEGEWSNALNSWISGWNSFDETGKIDPRLGIAFIETVMEQKFRAFLCDSK